METIEKLIKCYFDGRIILLEDCKNCKKHCSNWGDYDHGCLTDHPRRISTPRKHQPFPRSIGDGV